MLSVKLYLDTTTQQVITVFIQSIDDYHNLKDNCFNSDQNKDRTK